MDHPQEEHPTGSFKSCVLGFILSLLLTLASFICVSERLLPQTGLLYVILTLAVIQTVVQLILFLHLGEETKPKWKLLTFFFMLSILIIVVLGSLWIMAELDYNMMPSMSSMHHPSTK